MDQSNQHFIQGVARKTISALLFGCLDEGLFEQTLRKEGLTQPVIDQIKQEVRSIAETHHQQAVYHKARWEQQEGK